MKAGVTKIGAAVAIADEKSGPAKETLKREFIDSLFYLQVKFPVLATRRDYYMALAYMVRDQLCIAGSAPLRLTRGSSRAPSLIFPPNS